MANNEEIMQECLARMVKLGLDKSCINAFKKGKVWESEGIGALYELNEKEQEIINEFEKENNGYKVYHLIHNIWKFEDEEMEIYSLLYVGTDKDEWQYDNEDINNNMIMAYCKNTTDDYCSEFGTITFKKNIGGLIRIY